MPAIMRDASDHERCQQRRAMIVATHDLRNNTTPATMGDASNSTRRQQDHRRCQQPRAMPATKCNASNNARCLRPWMMPATTGDSSSSTRRQQNHGIRMRDVSYHAWCEQSHTAPANSHTMRAIIYDLSINMTKWTFFPTGPCFSTGISLVLII